MEKCRLTGCRTLRQAVPFGGGKLLDGLRVDVIGDDMRNCNMLSETAPQISRV